VNGVERLSVQLGFVEFPPGFTCEGGNLSPALALGPLAPQVESLAVVAVNPFEEGCSFCPWVIWNLPPVTEIPAGIPPVPVTTVPIASVQGTNDYGEAGYHGPCPPHGETHRYRFKVYDLDARIDLAAGSDKHALINAMKGHVIQFGDTEAMYRRP
jgi:Raf kinase inhibitor-like YbhB/YbcL family protein